jgi:hypothetical protein
LVKVTIQYQLSGIMLLALSLTLGCPRSLTWRDILQLVPKDRHKVLEHFLSIPSDPLSSRIPTALGT